MTEEKPRIKEWPEKCLSGSKRTHITESDWLPDWFVGFGKEESCDFEGTWWDMICFARNILASENTKLVAPEFYKPELKNENYTGESRPYLFGDEE
jgi:hypothetical protein